MTLFLLLGGASLALFLPLRRRPHFWQRVLLCLAVALVPMLALSWGLQGFRYFLVSSIAGLLWGVAAARFCVELSWTASLYCSIWILLTADVIYELWLFLSSLLGRAGWGLAAPDTAPFWAMQLVFFCRLLCADLCHHRPGYAGGRRLPHRPAADAQRRAAGRDVLVPVSVAAKHLGDAPGLE